MTEMSRGNADENEERRRSETTIEEETPMLGDHEDTTQVSEFMTMDERESSVLSRRGEILMISLNWDFSLHTVLWQLYIENQKHLPNIWIYDAFLLDKQLSIWRIVQNRCPFL